MRGRHGGFHHRWGGQDGGLVGRRWANGFLDREDSLGRWDGAHGRAVLSWGWLTGVAAFAFVMVIIVGVLLLPDGQSRTLEVSEAEEAGVGIGGWFLSEEATRHDLQFKSADVSMSNQWKKKCRKKSCTVSRYDFYMLFLLQSLCRVAPPTPTQSFRLVKLSKINGRTPTLSFSSLLLPPASSPLIKERSMRDLGKTLGFSTLLTLHQKVGRSKGVNYYSNIPNRHFLLVVGVVSFKILLRLLQIFQIQIFLWTIFNVNWHLIWSYL